MNAAENEEEALNQARRFLSYMPKNVFEVPARESSRDDPQRREEGLLTIVPTDKRRVYKARQILNMVLDQDTLFEIGAS